jgi:CheY-like chemotaxis protein
MSIAPETIVVLYIEDDSLTRQSVSNRLIRNGLRVLAADSGEQALALIADRPALTAALLDLQLPGIDGFETCARIRAEYPRLPVIVCSGYLEAPVRNRLAAAGIPPHCQLGKPCPFRELLAAIIKAIGVAEADDGAHLSGAHGRDMNRQLDGA